MDWKDVLGHYLDLGWVVVPTRADNSRAPVGNDWQVRTKPVRNPKAYRHGAYLVCGKASGVSVIDIDDPKWFTTFAPLALRKTAYAATPSGGAHILVSYSDAEWWRNQVGFVDGIDLRNDGGGIALPLIEDGRWWSEGHAPWEIGLADPEPYEQLLLDLAGKAPGRSSGKPTHTLTELLNSAPEIGERSDWLITVAGHLAPMIDYEDAWLALVQTINRSMDVPLGDPEIKETVGTLWKRDRSRNPVDQHSDEPWSVTDGIVKYHKGKGQKREAHDWIRPAVEVVEYRLDVDGNASWVLRRGNLETVITSVEVHNIAKAGVALTRVECALNPQACSPQPHATELYRWLMSHRLAPKRQAPYWGWNSELNQWVGLEGDAVGPDEYRPEIGDIDRPDIVEQLPTWQEGRVASVFCAWIALQAVKGAVEMTIEPNLVLQGTAGSGKSRGLFSFGARLTGSPRVASGSIPSIRDRIAGHRNGIVVIDDHANLEGNSARLLELYRVSTTADSISLKQGGGTSAWTERKIRLVGSIMASGENLADLSDDRALRDRSVILEVPPANKRVSIHDPDRSQWSDITAVFQELEGHDEATAHRLAGPFIRRMLAAAERIGQPEIESGERVEVKLALLRYGARLWQEAYPGSRTDDAQTVDDAVDDWCEEQSQSSGWRDTTLVRKILPALVDPSVGALHAIGITEEGRVFLHPQRLSREWCRHHRTPRDLEVGSEANIRRELDLLAETGQAERRVNQRVLGQVVKVWRLAEEASAVILAAAGVAIGEDADELPFA